MARKTLKQAMSLSMSLILFFGLVLEMRVLAVEEHDDPYSAEQMSDDSASHEPEGEERIS